VKSLKTAKIFKRVHPGLRIEKVMMPMGKVE
jgi:hypothetical protein